MEYKDYLIRKAILVIPVLLGLTLVIFIMTRLLPGDPATLALGPNATPEQALHLRELWGLDDPLPIQYYSFLRGIIVGDWGLSLRTGNPVTSDVGRFMPATLELVTVAVFFAVIIGTPLGVVSAVNKDRVQDHASRLISLIGIAMPAFWIGILLQLWISSGLRLLPVIGRLEFGIESPSQITGLYLIDSLITGNFVAFSNSFEHLLLPAFTLSLPALANISRLVRSTMIDQRSKDYTQTAISYGLPFRLITYKYMLRNAMIPTVAFIAALYPVSLGSAVLVEAVFSWPGLGTYLVDSIYTKDIPAIGGSVIVIGTMVVFFNFIAELAYGYLDPRIRSGEK